MLGDLLGRWKRPGRGHGKVSQPSRRVVHPHRFPREPAVGRVRPGVVVVEPPAFNNGAGLGQGGEDLLIQTFVTQLSVEAFDEAVLLGVAQGDLTPIAAGAVGPFRVKPVGHFRPVIAGDSRGLPAPSDQG